MFAFVFFCTLLYQLVPTFGVMSPLAFDYDKENPLKSRIYLNPMVSIGKVKELSGRDISFYKSNETFALEEDHGEWFTLVQNENEPSPRYAQLKSALCRETDWRISYFDKSGAEQETVTLRAPATPQEWKPEAKVEVKSTYLEDKAIVAKIDWYIWHDKLEGYEPLGFIEPYIELISCDTLFDKPVPPPVVYAARKLIYFHTSYADHKCLFTIRLRVTVYDPDEECRPVLFSSNEKSVNLTLSCDQISGYKCKTYTQTECKMTCNVQLKAEGVYDWDEWGRPFPTVKLEWSPLSTEKMKIKGSVIKFNQLQSTFNNFALTKLKTNVEYANRTSFNITPFSSNTESFLGVQVCIYNEKCSKEPKWEKVPMHSAYLNQLIKALPPPPPITTTTTTTTTTTPPPTTTTTTEEPTTTALRTTKKKKKSSHHPRSTTKKPTQPPPSEEEND